MECPNCGRKNEDESRFCYQCGIQLQEQNLSDEPVNDTVDKDNNLKVNQKRMTLISVTILIIVILIAVVCSIFGKNSGNGDNSNSVKSNYLDSFSIEGTWKNVGNTTCAQIQEGSIVNFDGSNCNVYSPNDTYAFYEADGVYHLDCTSPFASDSLCFTVNIVDSDNIELISSGSTVIKLCRVGGTKSVYNNYIEDITTTSTTTTTVPNTDIPIKSVEFEYKNPSGYSYHITVEMSPWIFDNKPNIINEAAKKICTGNPSLPTDKSGWLNFMNGFDYIGNITDVYVSVGHITIENTTKGWDFSETNPGQQIFMGDFFNGNERKSVTSKIFYSGKTDTDCFNLEFAPKMTANRCGIDFVVAYHENITPNNPNGTNFDLLNEGYFVFGPSTDNSQKKLKIGVYQ